MTSVLRILLPRAGATPGVNRLFIGSLAVLAVSFAIAAFNLLTQGHAAFNTSNYGIAWGLPIVTYDYFLSLASGLALVAGMALAFGPGEWLLPARRCAWAGLAAIAAGGAVLMLELGHPLRSLVAIPFNFQYVSPMFWKVPLIGVNALLLLGIVAKVSGMRLPVSSRALGAFLFVAAGLLTVVSASIFGMMAMRPMWYEPMLPVYALAEAALLGIACAILILRFGGGAPAGRFLLEQRASWLLAPLIAISLVAVVSRAVTGLWSNAEGLQAWAHIVRSPLFFAELAALVLALGMLLLPAMRDKPGITPAAAALVLVAAFIGRYEFIIGGQLVPLFKGSWIPDLIEYAPSLTEWLLSVIGLSIALAGYALGERLFGADAESEAVGPS